MSGALSEVARLIQRESGIELGPSQLPSLQAAIARVDPDFTAEALLQRAVPPEILGRLIDEVTIRETFFFRHRAELDAIEWHTLLDSARARGSEVVRVWVAGCASGEEAYTVAILACQAFACLAPPVRVLATDIAPTALAQATRGRYGERAVRAVSGEARERYFTREHGLHCVGERLGALVEVRRHNLVRDAIPPAGEQFFDVILCRNVLIYFDRPTVEHVLGGLERALAPAGLLLLGAADRLSGQRMPVVRLRRSDAAGSGSSRTPAPVLGEARGRAAPHRTGTGARRSEPARGESIWEPPQPRPTPAEAMRAADRGELDLAVQIARNVLAGDPLDSQAHFIRGVAELARGDARAAVEPLRRALYIDPNHRAAAFKLACAHDALGEPGPARRAYERTLRTLDHYAVAQPAGPDQLDMTAACHTRLSQLTGQRPPERPTQRDRPAA